MESPAWLVKKEHVGFFALNKAVMEKYKEDAPPLSIASVALGKLQGSQADIIIKQNGLIYPSDRLRENLPLWKVWITKEGSLIISRPDINNDKKESSGVFELPEDATYIESIAPLHYLTAVCSRLGLSADNIATSGLDFERPYDEDYLKLKSSILQDLVDLKNLISSLPEKYPTITEKVAGPGAVQAKNGSSDFCVQALTRI